MMSNAAKNRGQCGQEFKWVRENFRINDFPLRLASQLYSPDAAPRVVATGELSGIVLAASPLKSPLSRRLSRRLRRDTAAMW